MTVWSMVGREVVRRRWGFLSCLAASAVASGLLVGSLVGLALHDAQAEAMLRRKEAETRAMLDTLKADVQTAMHRLGYNAVILPKDQPLDDWYAEDYASKTMPASWAARLDETPGVAERYLPRLRRKLKWPERKRSVIIVGLGEERVLGSSATRSEPLVRGIPRRACRLGYELHRDTGVKPGDQITIQGQPFRVDTCVAEMGTKDDITIWMSLADAQDLLDLPGCVNEILMVEHLDVWGNLPEVRGRVANALPECQVIEIGSQTLARMHARRKVAEEAETAVIHERRKQAALRADRQRLIQALGLLGFLICALWVGLVLFANVRERATEMAILIAMGFHRGHLLALVLGKALLIGGLGGGIGAVAGTAVGLCTAAAVRLPAAALAGFVCLGLAVAVGASVLGSWLPAWGAAHLDPAVVLGEE